GRSVHGEVSLFSYSEYKEYRDHNHVFSGVIAYEPFSSEAVLLANGRPQQVYGQSASCNYFEVLNEHPAQGRGFLETDCASQGQGAVVVLGDAFWRTTFAADEHLLGRQIVLNRTNFTVVGITPPGFGGTEAIPSAFWIPITMQKVLSPNR